MKLAHFKTTVQLERAGQPATVTINRGAGTFSVRLYRRRKRYELPLSVVAQLAAWTVISGELEQKRKAKREARRARR